MLTVNFSTFTDADFIRGFVLRQRFPEWVADRLYAEDDVVDHLGIVWTALADNPAVEPGTDPAKWEKTDRPPLDLSGSALNMMARRSGDAIEAVYALDSADGSQQLSITDDDGGAFTLWLPRALLQRITPGVYAHSLLRLRPDGLREAIWRGVMTHAIGPTR